MITAVIGIGSNSIRMLVADVDGTTARRVLRDREGTRLFAGLDANRTLSEESMTRTADAAARMASKARALGAGEVRLFATSATRDAANADVFAALLRGKADLELEICSGEEEASLSFLGATDGGYAGVIDIGGGSTEYVVGENERIDCAFSCQMGAVRLFGMQPIRSSADLPAVEQMADNILTEQLAAHPILRMP